MLWIFEPWFSLWGTLKTKGLVNYKARGQKRPMFWGFVWVTPENKSHEELRGVYNNLSKCPSGQLCLNVTCICIHIEGYVGGRKQFIRMILLNIVRCSKLKNLYDLSVL